jgi:AcrR family transcriptional regulator
MKKPLAKAGRAKPRKGAKPKQPRGDGFVKKVLEATLAELASSGLERLSIPEVATQAGVNKTSIYRRWPTKEALVQEALSTAMAHTAAAPRAGDLRQDLIALASSVATFLESEMGKSVMQLVLAGETHSDLRAIAGSLYLAQASSAPLAVMSAAAEQGALAPGLDPGLVLFTLAGGLMHRVLVERAEVTPAYLAQLVDLLLQGAARRGAP